jgi:hypothetical protein
LLHLGGPSGPPFFVALACVSSATESWQLTADNRFAAFGTLQDWLFVCSLKGYPAIQDEERRAKSEP